MHNKVVNIEVRGVTYPDTKAAAKALGVKTGTVLRAVRHDKTDTLGLGKAGRKLMPICIRGQHFESAKAAAAHFGVTIGAIRQALSCNRLDRVGLKPRPGRHNAKPFKLGGLSFPSTRAASIALGFRGEYISHVIARGNKRGAERIIAAAMRMGAASQKKAAQRPAEGRCAP